MQKGFSTVVILLGLLLILLGGFMVFGNSLFPANDNTLSSPGERIKETTSSAIKMINQLEATSPSQITEKSYLNTQLGFELILPKEAAAHDDTEEAFNKRVAGADYINANLRKNFTNNVGYAPPEVMGIAAILDNTENFEISPLQIWVFNNSNNLTIEQWYKDYWYYPFVWGDMTDASKSKVAPVEDLSFPGLGAKSAVISYQPGKPKFVYISQGNKMYLFKVLGEGDKILSTLKLH